jgi:hypothetical protein
MLSGKTVAPVGRSVKRAILPSRSGGPIPGVVQGVTAGDAGLWFPGSLRSAQLGEVSHTTTNKSKVGGHGRRFAVAKISRDLSLSFVAIC